MNIPTSDDLFNLINARYSAPVDLFPKAFWYQEMISVVEKLCMMLDIELMDSVEIIESDNLTSPEFGIEIPTKIVREPRIELIRSELPDVFERAVYITPYDAQKFIGSDELYRIAKEKAGSRFAAAEKLNLKKLDDALTPEERSHYIKVEAVPSGVHRVVRL